MFQPAPSILRIFRQALVAGMVVATLSSAAAAFTITLAPAAPKMIYLQVGTGSYAGTYVGSGTPFNNVSVNTVTLNLAAGVVGNRTAQTMRTNSAAANSFYNGRAFCTLPGELYIGGFYRTAGVATAPAQVVATVPAALLSALGDSIPFSKISWTSSGIGDAVAGPQPFPKGSFVGGGTQSVGSMASNSWNESCWTFSYLNDTVPAAATYNGRVSYTMSAP
jgi:uncharacterized membrane protein YgcG